MAFMSHLVRLKKLSLIWLIFLGSLFYFACEKDDICADGDTPLLIIRFYDAENVTEFKTVPNLRVVGIGQGNPVTTFNDRTTIDSIGIPLRINEPDTGFMLILNSAGEDGAETGNIDTLSFSYDTREVYISRACGFVANYDALTDDLTSGSDNWIQNIEIVSSLVQKQDSAHVKIFH
jgi:hypothetical protein